MPKVEVRRDRTIGRQKALSLFRGFEPLQASFPLTHGLVGVLRTLVQIPVLPMPDTGQHLSLRRVIAVERIHDDHPRDVCQALEQLAEELLCRNLMTMALHQNLEDMALLIHGSPEIVMFTVNGEKDLIKMPRISWLGPSTPHLLGIGWPPRPTPLPHDCSGQDPTAPGPQLFDIAVAEAAADLEPDTMAHDLRRKPRALRRVGCGWWVQAASMPHKTPAGKWARSSDNAAAVDTPATAHIT
jgi:hypothetical protein